MDDILPVVDGLETKVRKLSDAYIEGKTEIKKLKGELNELKETVENQKKTISDLEEKYKVVKLAKSISGENGESRELKYKINELVREIDKCMALLNN